MNGIAKIQHYVPQFLLKNFGNGKKDQVHVFDKKTGKKFPTNIKNVASESRFYDFNIEGAELTIEPSLSKIEANAKPILKKILDEDSLKSISREEKERLCSFLAIQFTRTRAFKEQFRALPEMLSEKLKELGQTPEQHKSIAEFIRSPDENELKIQMIHMMKDAPSTFGPHFASKHWILITTDGKNPFIIGDNPLAMQNTNNYSPYGNLGLAVQGIEIYLPLSPTRALAMWCPSITNQIEQAVSTLNELRGRLPYLIDGRIENPDYLEDLWSALSSGRPLQYKHENVTNFNSLQVWFSERHVFSSSKDFELAEKMVTEHPSSRNGPRPHLG